MDITRQHYTMMLVLRFLLPAVISAVLILILPQKYAKTFMKTAFLVIVLWFGVIQPIRVLWAMAMLYNSQPLSVSQVIQGNVQQNGTPPVQDFIAAVKTNADLRHTVIETWSVSFVNSLIKAMVAAGFMFAVYGIKSLFAKEKDGE